MTKSIDFYFDIISPYSYLAYKKIKILKKNQNIIFKYKPILLGGLHNLQKITAPAFIKPKLEHMINDCALIAKKNNFDFMWNNKFPINSLNIMRGCLLINDNELYLEVMFDAYWKDNLDTSNKKILKTLLEKCKINSETFFEDIKNPKIKNELKSITQEAYEKGIFGAPTFLVSNKIFWGQDRLEFALNEYHK